MKTSRRGLTLVELMVVIAIIGVLITMVATTAASAMRSARAKRRDAMAKVLREGLTTYYARHGRWPAPLESVAEQGSDKTFADTEADEVFRLVVKGSSGSAPNPCIDPHALFVAPERTAGTYEGKGYGVSFDEAVMKNPPPRRRRLGLGEMAFGFQDPSNGKFRRYAIRYVSESDYVRVGWMYRDRHGNKKFTDTREVR